MIAPESCRSSMSCRHEAVGALPPDCGSVRSPAVRIAPTLLLDGVIDATRQHRLTKRLFTRLDGIFHGGLPPRGDDSVGSGHSSAGAPSRAAPVPISARSPSRG